MKPIAHEKLEQAVSLLPEFGLDLWLLLGRETGELCDPSLALLLETAVTWTSAFLVHASGERIAIVGRYDVHNVEQAGGFTRVIGYDADIAPVLLQELRRLDPRRIGLNFSRDDHTSDGLTVGLWLSLQEWLKETPYRERLVSAERFAAALRGRKSPGEVRRMEEAIARTVQLLDEVPALLADRPTEQQLQARIHQRVDDWGAGTAWERQFCPIVNFGPDSAVGHAPPGPIRAAEGQVVHLDFGVRWQAYCADLQRCWYIAREGEEQPPAEVQRAFDTVVRAIAEAAAFLRPGRTGAEADAVARKVVTDAGYDEYKHALGHQVGRTCHDGATLLGPRWPRYGATVEQPVRPGEVYTLELGVMSPAGYVSLEEMVVVTEQGCRFLTEPQRTLPVLRLS